MTTAVAVRAVGETTTPDVRTVPAEINFGDLLALSKELVSTGFLPDHIKNPGQAAAIILTGRELGMAPMRALRSLQVVKGKVVESADSQLARFKADGGRAVFTRLDDGGAVLELRHPNGDTHTETFTEADAKRAGLAGDNYRKFPRAMYRSRAITAGLKSLGWEGGVGTYDATEAAEFLPGVVVEAPEPAPVAAVSEKGAQAPTEKQQKFLLDMLSSHVFTDAERKMYLDAMSDATRASAKELLTDVKTLLDTRKALESEQGERRPAHINSAGYEAGDVTGAVS